MMYRTHHSQLDLQLRVLCHIWHMVKNKDANNEAPPWAGFQKCCIREFRSSVSCVLTNDDYHYRLKYYTDSSDVLKEFSHSNCLQLHHLSNMLTLLGCHVLNSKIYKTPNNCHNKPFIAIKEKWVNTVKVWHFSGHKYKKNTFLSGGGLQTTPPDTFKDMKILGLIYKFFWDRFNHPQKKS